jgi:hypothetical protein
VDLALLLGQCAASKGGTLWARLVYRESFRNELRSRDILSWPKGGILVHMLVCAKVGCEPTYAKISAQPTFLQSASNAMFRIP